MSGLVNAILRRVSRETEEFQTALGNSHGLPSWLFKRLKKDWPEQLTELCQNLKQTAPLTLRVNQRQISRDEYLEILDEEQIGAHACDLSDAGIVLEQTGNITQLPGFEEFRTNMRNCAPCCCPIWMTKLSWMPALHRAVKPRTF